MKLTRHQRSWLEFARDKPADWDGVIPIGGAQNAMVRRLESYGLVEFVDFGRNEARERVDDHRERPIYRITDAGRRALTAADDGGEEKDG